jgi:hypothetical protein
MRMRPILNVLYDAEANVAFLQFGESPLGVAIRANIQTWKNTKVLAEFCAHCAVHGGVPFPVEFEDLTWVEAERHLNEFVSSCTCLLDEALSLAANFPVQIGPEDDYVNAAARGKLREFDLVAKAIVDENSCGGFIKEWKAEDAYSALITALADNEWNLPASLLQARTELGLRKPNRPKI